MPGFLRSKKVWATGLGVLAAMGCEYAGLSIETTIAITTPIVAYILGQGVADLGKEAEQVAREIKDVDASSSGTDRAKPDEQG